MAARPAGRRDKPGPPQDLSLRYVPVVDGRTLPAHPFEPASDLSADIPILTGSNECEGIPYGNPDDPYWTTEPTDAAVAARARQSNRCPMSDSAADQLIALYRSHRPNDTLGDIAASSPETTPALRQASYTIAERKFAQGSAPGVSLLLQLAITGSQRQASHDALHGAAVRVRPSGSSRS